MYAKPSVAGGPGLLTPLNLMFFSLQEAYPTLPPAVALLVFSLSEPVPVSLPPRSRDETFTFYPELASYSFDCVCKSVGQALKVASHMSTAWMMPEAQCGSGQERQGERAVT